MMEAVRTSETSVDNYFTWQYIPEDNSEHHTRRRENLKSHKLSGEFYQQTNGVTMDSPLLPVLSNIYTDNFEKIGEEV
jgi:hypothetical protein